MVLRSNLHEFAEISRFCREHTKDFFRFDPLLHQRYDRDPRRNAEILAERLSPEEIAAVEQSDPERASAMQKDCDSLIFPDQHGEGCAHIFHCGAGQSSFSVGYEGTFRLCSSLNQPGTTADLHSMPLAEAWNELVPRVRALESDSQEFRTSCRACPLVNLCIWCPANAALETGRMDEHTDYFCQVAHARAAAIRNSL